MDPPDDNKENDSEVSAKEPGKKKGKIEKPEESVKSEKSEGPANESDDLILDPKTKKKKKRKLKSIIKKIYKDEKGSEKVG